RQRRQAALIWPDGRNIPQCALHARMPAELCPRPRLSRGWAMADRPTPERSNRILARLDAGDARLLTPHLQPGAPPVLRRWERRARRTAFVYFIDSGFASVLADGGSSRSVEV